MARAVTTQRKVGFTIGAWIVALLIFFPILYTIITSLKSEQEAISGFHLIPSFTLESYREVQGQQNYFRPFFNSVILSVGSTALALLISVPAAWAMAFSPGPKTKDLLMWMLSTKMMPAVAVLMPIYLIFLRFGLIDTRIGLTVMLMLINLPIVIWMLYTYFREIPGEILEAARMDGASLWGEIWHVLTPMAVPGIASTLRAAGRGIRRPGRDVRRDRHLAAGRFEGAWRGRNRCRSTRFSGPPFRVFWSIEASLGARKRIPPSRPAPASARARRPQRAACIPAERRIDRQFRITYFG